MKRGGAPSLVARRRVTRKIHVGSVAVGGDAPISVQSMTNTDTSHVPATIAQIAQLVEAGADIVRIACPDESAAEAIGPIRSEVSVPLIADIHFDYRLALTAIQQGIDGLRLNPGNIGGAHRVREVVAAAMDREIPVPIRIGVNAGSLDRSILDRFGEPSPEAMVASALEHVRLLEDLAFHEIKISLKASHVGMAVTAYRLLSEQLSYPLHIGITEAGGVLAGSVKSAIGLGLLLSEGIGDTLRVSLSANPVKEVRVGFEILKALSLRSRGVTIIGCPTCARQMFPVIDVVNRLEDRLAHVREPVTLSVIGCVVNGPGEARESFIGVTGGKGGHLLYRKGEVIAKLSEDELIDRIVLEISDMRG